MQNTNNFSILSSSTKFLEIHFKTSSKPYLRFFLVILFVLCLAPVIISPALLFLVSTFIILLFSFIFIHVLINVSSDLLLLKFDGVDNRLYCYFSPNSRTSSISYSLLDITCFSFSVLPDPSNRDILAIESANTLLKNILINFKITDFTFNVGPISKITLEELSILEDNINSFFQTNNLTIKTTNSLKFIQM